MVCSRGPSPWGARAPLAGRHFGALSGALAPARSPLGRCTLGPELGKAPLLGVLRRLRQIWRPSCVSQQCAGHFRRSNLICTLRWLGGALFRAWRSALRLRWKPDGRWTMFLGSSWRPRLLPVVPPRPTPRKIAKSRQCIRRNRTNLGGISAEAANTAKMRQKFSGRRPIDGRRPLDRRPEERSTTDDTPTDRPTTNDD